MKVILAFFAFLYNVCKTNVVDQKVDREKVSLDLLSEQ